MKWLERYVNAVKTYLPNHLKQDVSDELLSTLQDECDDKAEQLGRELNDNEVHDILLKRGHPMMVAASYQPRKTLVSESLFPFYTLVLKWVLLAMLIAQCVGQGIQLFTGSDTSIISIAWNVVAGTWHSGFQAFAWVTLIFYLLGESLSRQQIFANWHPKQLPKTTRSGNDISYFESGVELFFQIMFVGYINQLFHTPAIHLVFSTIEVSEQVIAMVPWINMVMIISIAYTLLKILYPFWTRRKILLEWLIYLPTFAVMYALYRVVPENTIQIMVEGQGQVFNVPAQWWQHVLIVMGGIFIFDIAIKARRFRQLSE